MAEAAPLLTALVSCKGGAQAGKLTTDKGGGGLKPPQPCASYAPGLIMVCAESL